MNNNKSSSSSSSSSSSNEEDEGNWKIVYIPEKPRLPPHLHPTVNVYASLIDDPKDANNLVRKLNKIAPLENLRHVKRVRRQCLDGGKTQLSVILCLACGDDSHLDAMPNDVLELINANQLSTFITKVSKYAASSKEEWEEQSKLWPTSYHPPTYNIDGITGFSAEDSQSVFNFMKAAVDLAKSGDDQLVNAAVIVDPSTKQLVASACDEALFWNRNTTINKGSEDTSCSEQPLEASTNSIVDQVKTRMNTVSNCSTDEMKRLYKGVSCLHPWGWAEQQLGTSCSFWHPLRHAAIVAIEHSAARDKLLFPVSVHNREKLTPEVSTQSPSTGTPSKRQKTNLTNVEDDKKLNSHSQGCHSESGRPYLCTGYDIYLVWEPCTMCAMALVHQRIKRIFYAFPNPDAGALGSAHRLQGEKSLNHHYAVFRVLLPQEVLDEGQTVIATAAVNDQTETHVC